MSRKAVKYNIENFLEKFVIDNQRGYEIYLDIGNEHTLVDFIRENVSKFIYVLRFILGPFPGKVYKKGPHCTMEMRFLKNGKHRGKKGLNSRVYVITHGNKLVLCLLDPHKKSEKVESKVSDQLKEMCDSVYTYDNTNTKNLIEI